MCYLISEMIAKQRVVQEGDQKEGSPKEHICRCDNQEHVDSLHPLALHALQVIPHAAMLFQRSAWLHIPMQPTQQQQHTHTHTHTL